MRPDADGKLERRVHGRVTSASVVGIPAIRAAPPRFFNAKKRSCLATRPVLPGEESPLPGGRVSSPRRETRFSSQDEPLLLEEVSLLPPGRTGSSTTENGLSLEACSLLPPEEAVWLGRRAILPTRESRVRKQQRGPSPRPGLPLPCHRRRTPRPKSHRDRALPHRAAADKRTAAMGTATRRASIGHASGWRKLIVQPMPVTLGTQSRRSLAFA